MAHELTHVIQQKKTTANLSNTIQRLALQEFDCSYFVNLPIHERGADLPPDDYLYSETFLLPNPRMHAFDITVQGVGRGRREDFAIGIYSCNSPYTNLKLAISNTPGSNSQIAQLVYTVPSERKDESFFLLIHNAPNQDHLKVDFTILAV